METIQFLTKDQINGLVTILERDYILPQINNKLKAIRESDKYKDNYTTIEDFSSKCIDICKDLKKMGVDNYCNLSVEKELLDKKTLESLKIREIYVIKNRIIDDLKSRLQLIVPTDFETIIKNISEHIDVDKHLYKEEVTIPVDEDDEDYDLYD